MKQDHMKGKARGSVLFTVVTVMMIMVVFLMSTLILTTASHRRSYYTYYETQAQYAAQAALDAVTNYAYSDRDFSLWVQGISDNDPHDFYVQFDGSTLPLSDTSIAGADHYVVCTVQKDQPNYVWDDVSNAIRETEGWKITATAFVGRGRNQASYSMVNYIYANIKTDTAAGTQNSLEFTNYQWDQANAPDSDDDPPDDEDIASVVANAVYSLSGYTSSGEGNMLILGPQYVDMASIPVGRINYNADNAPKNGLSNDNEFVGNVMFVNNMQIEVTMPGVFQMAGENIKVYGNLTITNNNSGIGFTVNSTLNDTEKAKIANYKQINYVYVDGSIIGVNGNGKFSFGMDEDSCPINLFAGAINANGGASTVAVKGDIYLYDPDLPSSIGTNGDTVLATFIDNEVNGKNSTTSNKLGNLICNNSSLTLGNQAGKTTTIDGDFYYTNPAGSVTINGTLEVKGKAYFACPQDKVTGTVSCGNIVYSATTVAGYGDSYPTNYAASIPSANYDYRLFPYSYRLDEIFTTYYRWDLADNDDWQDDPLVKESIAAGHTWTTKAFYGGFVEGSSPFIEEILTVDQANARLQAINPSWSIYYYDHDDPALADIVIGSPYWDGSYNANVLSWKTPNPNYDPDDVEYIWVNVPCTTPVTASNAFMEPFEPVNTSTTGSIAQGVGGDTKLAIDTYTRFVGLFMGADTAYQITDANKKTMTYFTAVDGSDSLQAITEDVYFVNQNCTIDVSSLGGKTVLIDNTSVGGQSLGIVLKGRVPENMKILTNNTAIYGPDGSVQYVYGPDDENIPVEGYTQATVKGSGTYAGRTDVCFFMADGFNAGTIGGQSQRTLLVSTGMYNAAMTEKFDIVSNPIYPEQEGYDALRQIPNAGTGEMWKFMLVPNSVVFGQSGSNYDLSILFTNSAMLMFNSSVSRNGEFNKVSSNDQIAYREYHDSKPYNPVTASTNPKSFIGAGLMVVSSSAMNNRTMIAFIGDTNRPNEKTPANPPDPTSVTTKGGNTHDPNATDGKDYFSNDHQGAS